MDFYLYAYNEDENGDHFELNPISNYIVIKIRGEKSHVNDEILVEDSNLRIDGIILLKIVKEIEEDCIERLVIINENEEVNNRVVVNYVREITEGTLVQEEIANFYLIIIEVFDGD